MKKIIVLNHKGDLSFENAKKYPIKINEIIRSDQDVIIFPCTIYLPYFKGKYNFKLGSQIISKDNITGDLTSKTLKSMEIKYAFVNSADRKNKYDINANEVNNLIMESINNSIIPIVTIGETYYENELNKTMNVISKQIKEYFKDIDIINDIIICYTPDYSYKGKQIPKIDHISEVITLIKDIIKKKYDSNIKVIYGGNVNIDNIKQLDEITNLNGYLVEEISTDISKVKQILNEIK